MSAAAGYANFMEGFYKGRDIEDDRRRSQAEDEYREELRGQQRTRFNQEQADRAADAPIVASRRALEGKTVQYVLDNFDNHRKQDEDVRQANVDTAVANADVAKLNAADAPSAIDHRKWERDQEKVDAGRRQQLHNMTMARQQLGLQADRYAAEGNRLALDRTKRQIATMDILGAFAFDPTPEGLSRAVDLFNKSNDVYAGQDMEATMGSDGNVVYGPKGGKKVVASIDEFTRHFAAGLDPAQALISRMKGAKDAPESVQNQLLDHLDEKFKAAAKDGIEVTPDLIDQWKSEGEAFVAGKSKIKAGMSAQSAQGGPREVIEIDGVFYGTDRKRGLLYDKDGNRYVIKDEKPVRVK